MKRWKNWYCYTLSNGQQVFVAKISNDLIGIATQRVGLGSTGGFVGVGNSSSTIFFTGLGSGNNHSFKTIMNKLLLTFQEEQSK